MGLLDALLPPDHRDVAMVLKNRAVSKDMSDQERQVLAELQLKDERFVRERILFFCAFTRACLIHLGDERADKLIMMVRHFYDIYVEEYFKSQPGVDGAAGLQAYERARRRYGLIEKEIMYPTFLEQLNWDESLKRDNVLNRDIVDPQKFVLFSSLMDSYTKSSIDQIQKQIARVRE